MTISKWQTDETTARARVLWDEGLSAKRIANEIGGNCTKSAVLGLARRSGWPARAVCISYTPKLGYSDAQKAKLRELWTTSGELSASITEKVNACGPAKLTAQQVADLAKRMGLKRCRELIHKQAVIRGYKRWGTEPKPDKEAPIQIPLREVYQRCAELGLPRTKRGSLEALNRAIKREKPGHPGYALSNYHPSRLTWAI